MATDEFGRQLVFPYCLQKNFPDFLQKNFPDFFARFLEIKQKHSSVIRQEGTVYGTVP